MKYEKGELMYEGKAKKIFNVVNESSLVWMEFKDSLTAFNAQKKGSFESKGSLNKEIACFIFDTLKSAGIKHHLVSEVNANEVVCEQLTIIPLEVVVRNTLAGSTAKKFGLKEGTALEKPLVEFFYKDDELADPFMSDDQALMMKAAKNQAELEELKTLALKVNTVLLEMFLKAEIKLIDFKLEFGRNQQGEIVLGDEITPDSCRLWDIKTNEKMDKDRFRRDLGGVEEAYKQVLTRLKS